MKGINLFGRIRHLFSSTSAGNAALIVFGLSFFFLFLLAGMGVFLALAGAVLIPLALYLGYLEEFAGSVIFYFLLSHFRLEIIDLIGIWGFYPRIDKTINFILAQGAFNSILMIFFVVFTIRLFTGSIKLFKSG